jgi:hypothetical protein
MKKFIFHPLTLLILLVIAFAACMAGLANAQALPPNGYTAEYVNAMYENNTPTADTVIPHSQPASKFDFGSTLTEYIGWDFVISLVLVVFVMAAIRKLSARVEEKIVPHSKTNETVQVEVCGLNEFWSKIILCVLTAVAIWISRGAAGKIFFGYSPAIQIILTYTAILLVYFAKGQALAELLLGKLFAILNIGPLKDNQNVVSERDYLAMGKTEG